MRSVLNKTRCDAILAGVAKGAPFVAVASSFGVDRATANAWITTGMSVESDPPPAGKTDELVKVDGPLKAVKATTWREHIVQCRRLADNVMKMEGLRVTELTVAMWKSALRKKFPDREMQKFLFRHYVHVHGMVADAAPAKPEDNASHEDKVVIRLPDNGRGPVK